MSEESNKKVAMTKDTVIYLIAKIIEGIVGVLTISVMSYIYAPSDIGKYSTLNIAVTTVAMVGIQWLIQSVIRYVSKYIVEGREAEFFSTVAWAWLRVNLLITLVFFVVLSALNILKSGIASSFFNQYPVFLLVCGLFMFFGYNTFQLVIGLLAGVRKAKVNLFLSVLNVVGKLVLITLFNNIFPKNIIWIFVSYAIIDIISSVIGIYKLGVYKYVKTGFNSSDILADLKSYGMPLMGNMVATSVLNKSDIYIITWILGEYASGVYQTNYSIIASAFTLISAGAMRGSYPTILKTWSEGDEALTEKLISNAVRTFLLISVPGVFGVFALSDFISVALFETSYTKGHAVMGFVAMGMFFLGMTEYAIKPWELRAKTKSIFVRSLFCGVLNIILNVALVPYFSYKICAVNTFLSFFIYFVLAKFGTRNYIKWNLSKWVYVRITFSALVMLISLTFLKRFFVKNLAFLMILVFIGIIIYFITLYLMGEIKSETKIIINKLKR